jgi:hypothetical protein
MIQEWRSGVVRGFRNRVSLCRTDACTEGPNAPAPVKSDATHSSSYISEEQLAEGEEQTGEVIWIESNIRRMGRQEKTELF